MEIQATVSDGFPKDTVDIVKANCQTLGFEPHDFEDE